MTQQFGFSLLELLITLIIISILTLLSVPIYAHYLAVEHRTEAEATLEKLAGALEQYYTVNNTYENANLSTLHFSDSVAKNTYRIVIVSATADDFLLQAEPSDSQLKADSVCGILTLNALGEKGALDNKKAQECWGI